MTLHHVTYEINKSLLVRELEFWSLLGFAPTGLRRRSRKQPPIHWLIGGDHDHAVELLPVSEPHILGLGHIALVVPERRWYIAGVMAERYGHQYEVCSAGQHFDFGLHAFFHSPSGHVVELFTYKKGLKSGPPLEER